MPSSPYALSKLAQEMLGAASARRRATVMIARAFNHFGPRQDPMFVASGFARRIADIERGRWAPEISVGNLDARRDLTDVRDTVRAYRLILERGSAGRPYNVCSGRAIAIRDLLDLLIARARVPVTVKIDPARYRPNDAPLLLGDPRRLRDELGWTPQIPTRSDARRSARIVEKLGGVRAVKRRYEGPRDRRHRLSRPRRRRRAGGARTRPRDRVRAHGQRGAAWPRTPSTATSAIARRSHARPPAATRSVHTGGARQHLAAAARGFRRRQRRRPAERPSRARRLPASRAFVYTSSFLALPPRDGDRADRGQRLPAHEGRRRSARRQRPSTRGSPLMRVYPGVDLWPGLADGRQSVGRLDRGPSERHGCPA